MNAKAVPDRIYIAGEDYRDDGLDAARGIVFALIFGSAFWLGVGYLFVKVL